MSPSGTTDWETALDLPLGAIGEQIRRIEAQLRAVNVVTAGMPDGSLPRNAERALAVRLEGIRTTLDALERLITEVERHAGNPDGQRMMSDDHGKHVRRTQSANVDD